ncbi:MAG: WecB/TagA/CpsF family glycosyltransferase [Tepidanaerobacter acetatoxydans]|jgi:N-acetylglucosaminyldiphosphoundecaprenol N-acetyl-beta-D-mannosaminyltransferase|uniref:WecB/TagA/CpsF family glycosyltransferase n=1 Tax=Tepidanaerobacter TaxID=499228 RepID=UPI000AB52C40|nr:MULTISPECIES: WecB/TagA/CpsF family glycosyltransferase [Tepidanaerobacter]NLU11082.1 WecB/TagA/CpsF family glycosyltransferase [Tepidanaerobacter acetatoxydans]
MNAEDRERINVLDVLLDCVDYEDACHRVAAFLNSYSNKVIVTPNAEIIMAAQKDHELKAVLNAADICLPDGIGVVIASKILGKPLAERTTGFDFMMKVLGMADKESLRLFLLGGKPGIAEKAGEKIKSMFQNIQIVGSYHGYFNEDDTQKVISIINNSKPDILLVAMGCPRQEMFMLHNKDKLKFRVAMGVGGSFDVLSGNVNRAPVFMQKAGLEWLYRLLTQPTRIKRISVLPLFLLKVTACRLTKNKEVSV